MLSVAKIGKCCQLPKLANFEDTKVAKIGKYLQLPNLANVVGCQNWCLNIPAYVLVQMEHMQSFALMESLFGPSHSHNHTVIFN